MLSGKPGERTFPSNNVRYNGLSRKRLCAGFNFNDKTNYPDVKNRRWAFAPKPSRLTIDRFRKNLPLNCRRNDDCFAESIKNGKNNPRPLPHTILPLQTTFRFSIVNRQILL
jgi:hypothetical protein